MKYFILLVIACTIGMACKNKDTQEVNQQPKISQSKKQINDGIEPHDAGNQAQNKRWNELIETVSKEEDYERMKKIFELSKKTDASYSTQYSLDVFEIYKRNPVFYIKVADQHYSGNFDYVLSFWINEVGDVTLADIEKYSKDVSNDPLVTKFIDQARQQDKILNEALTKGVKQD